MLNPKPLESSLFAGRAVPVPRAGVYGSTVLAAVLEKAIGRPEGARVI
jgi:hypothetical protein